MFDTAGTKLRRARLARQLTLEDAARVTRISAARLEDLEKDEYSNFPNIAYAKGFLRSYGKFLGVELKQHLDGFEDASTFGLDDYQYLSERVVGVYRVQRRQRQRPRFRRARVLAGTILVALAMIVGFVWYLYVAAQRLGDLDQLAKRQQSRARGAAAPGAEPPAATRPLLPASATPLPAALSPTPATGPTSGDNTGRELVALTLAESSPAEILRRLSAPAADVPMTAAATGQGNAPHVAALRSMIQKPVLPGGIVGNATHVAGSPEPTPDAGKKPFLVHALDRAPVDVFRTGMPRPPDTSSNGL